MSKLRSEHISVSGSNDRRTTPQRITLVCADLDGLPMPAFEYLVLYLNTLQKDVEYQFLPGAEYHSLISSLKPYTTINMDHFRSTAEGFVNELRLMTRQTAAQYNLRDRSVGRVLIISLSTLHTNYYELFEDGYSALFLGAWKTVMAPPSLLEFLVSLVMLEGVYSLLPSQAQEVSHLGTRGCIGDFNATLRDVRYKTLQGFICSDCRSLLEEITGPDQVATWTLLLKKNWFGTMSDPTSPASTVAKLGYNLFVTKGLEPSWREKVLKIISEDGVKELLKFVSAVLLAAVLLWWGLKKP